MTTESNGTNRFATPSDCLQIVTDIEKSQLTRSEDRALIDVQFNGGRPFTPEEEKQLQIQVNANFLEGYKLAQAGILQMNTALLYKERLCNLRCIAGKSTKRQEYSEKGSNAFNNPLKRGHTGKRWKNRLQNRNAALTLHGIGPFHWADDWNVLPRFVSLDDLLVPTDTPIDWSDECGHFAMNSWLTAWQLYKMTQSTKRDPGWNQTLGLEILKALLTSRNFTPDYFYEPEKMESLWKQRSTYLNSDSVPRVKITTIYHQDPENGSWWRKVILRENQQIGISSTLTGDFLYEGKVAYSESVDRIIHIQFGDGSVVAPFKYREVRGLGVLLYSIIELLNRIRCQSAQHLFSSLVPLFYLDNPLDRDRPKMFQYQTYGVVPSGLRFVKQEERHQVDPRLVQGAMSEFRQLMSENSASYVQDIDSGTPKQMTLGEAKIRLQSVNRMVASMLLGAYEDEVFLYEEMLRRMMKPGNTDPIAVKFMEKCRKSGIPQELMVPEAWQVEITRVAGAGDQTLAQEEVAALMSIINQLDPSAQRIVRRQFISVITRNPDYANQLVPDQPTQMTDGTKAADSVFGTLMNGIQIGLIEGIEQTDYIQEMMRLLGGVVQEITQTDNVGTPQQLKGMQTVASDVALHIGILSQDPMEKKFVVDVTKELTAIGNLIKAFGQRQAEAAQKDQQDPEAMAKLQMDQAQAEQKMKLAEESSSQKLQQKQAAFEQKMAHDQARFTAQMMQMMEEAKAQLTALGIKTAANAAATATKAEASAKVKTPTEGK